MERELNTVKIEIGHEYKINGRFFTVTRQTDLALNPGLSKYVKSEHHLIGRRGAERILAIRHNGSGFIYGWAGTEEIKTFSETPRWWENR